MSITSNSVAHSLPRATSVVGIGAGLVRAWHASVRWFRIVNTRQGLLEIDDRMLSDLGVSRAQAEFELNRMPWTRQR